MAATHNADVLAVQLRATTATVEREVRPELDTVAELMARRMKMTAPKFRTELTNSINVHDTGTLAREIKPGVAHGIYQEEGIKPGGKGLPRFFDPAATPIVEWLRSKAFSGKRVPRLGSRRRASYELELRDRYEGLAHHIRHHGVRAKPFVRPTFTAMEQSSRVRLMAAAERGLRATQGGAA